MTITVSSRRHRSAKNVRNPKTRLRLECLEDRLAPANLLVGLFSNEPTLAVNPLDPNNVVVADYNQGSETLKISNDGGATFPITTNAAPASHDGDDSLAFDSAGRLFWSYLQSPGVSVVVQQVNPTTGALVGSPVNAAGGTTNNDKAWIAADHNPASPFHDNLYIVWNDFGLSSTAPVKFARSTDHGLTWTVMSGTMSGSGEGFTWPAEVDVAPNGDVYAAWHVNSVGTGTNGGTRMRRSTDGGVTFGPELMPFPNGTADTQLNSGTAEGQNAPRIYKFKGWLQGSLQPRILADPARPGNIYVVSVTDPDQSYTDDGNPTGDASDIVIARSTDNGATWTRSTIGTPNDGKLEIMPAAAIDENGTMVVTWYQDLRPATNAQGDWLLGLFATTSTDGGVTFTPAVQVTDTTNPFDPDLNAPDRFGNQTRRIGEYNGLAIANGTAYAVWTGNEPTGQHRQATYFDKVIVTSSISGTVFNDINGGGGLDANPGLAGWTVFLDIHNDSMLDPDDPQTVTDALGKYTFVNPPQGTYVVREVLKDGWTQTAPPDGFYTVTVTSTLTTISGQDFGDQLINPSSISGTVFNDLNGSLDPGEPGLAGWTVFIDANNNGVLDPGERFAVSDASGHYTIAGLEPGQYRLHEVLQSGFILTAPVGGVYDITLSAGQDVAGQDFGNFKPIVLSGVVFNDLNGNGVQDAGEPGLAGWTVFDDVNNDGTLDPGDPSAITDATGHYTLSNIGPGTHIIREALRPNWALTAPADGFYTVIATSGQDVTNLNFANQSGTILGLVFNDLNGNGVHDSGEPPLSGWTIYLDLNNDGTLDPNDPRIVTGADGKYLFTGLAPGTYTVREVLQSGWVGTEPPAGSYTVTIVDTSTVAIDQDFGNFKLVTISGTVFNDINGNGTQDPGEPGLANWIVFDDVDNNGVFDPGEPSTVTNSLGAYNLANIGPGDHHIREFQFTGWTGTAPASGVYDITAASGVNVIGRNFGDQLINLASISGMVFEDLNASGVLDPSDPGQAGWTVYIDANNNGMLDPNEEFNVTDANGHFTLGGLTPGTYIVREVLKAGFTQSEPVTKFYTVTLAAGDNVTGFDFGNWRPVSISGNVFNDVNGNGIHEPEEANLPGWTTFLDRNLDGQFDGGIVEAGDFAAGTLLNTVHPKATLTTINGANGNVRALNSTLSSTGARIFGNDNFSNGLWGNGSTSSSPQLRIDFATPQASVSIDAISDGASRRGRLEIYDANNVLLGVYVTGTLTSPRQYETMALTRPTADIAYAIAGGDTGFFIFLDNLQFVETPGLVADPITTTNTAGNYSFTGLKPGTYSVGEVVVPGWVQTAPPDSFYTLTLNSGQMATGRDFGNQRVVTPVVIVDNSDPAFELPSPGWVNHLGGYGGNYLTHPPAASIQNGGFETDNFNDWTTLGNTSIKTSSFGTGPTEGIYDALVSNSGGPATSSVESFIGVTAGSLNGLGNGSVSNGSAIKQTFTVVAGTTLTFDWNFLTTESTSSTNPNNDFAFVAITPSTPGGTLATLASTHTPGFVTAPSSSGFFSMTGFKTFSFTFTADGTYTLSIGAVNVGDTFRASAVLVDNVRLLDPRGALWHVTPPSGPGTYELFATWVPLATNASSATYFIYDGPSLSGTLLGTVTVNQKGVPNDVLVNGALWKSLGTFSTSTGTFTIALGFTDANGDVLADAVFAA